MVHFDLAFQGLHLHLGLFFGQFQLGVVVLVEGKEFGCLVFVDVLKLVVLLFQQQQMFTLLPQLLVVYGLIWLYILL